MEQPSKNEDLMDAIASNNINVVRDCLESGADPNYTRHWDESESAGQPNTPLGLVMFCISDCLLEDIHLRNFAEIATLLLSYGADPKPAMEIAEYRYGKYDPADESGPFMDVWHIIARAK
jgi:hypothetical protein